MGVGLLLEVLAGRPKASSAGVSIGIYCDVICMGLLCSGLCLFKDALEEFPPVPADTGKRLLSEQDWGRSTERTCLSLPAVDCKQHLTH